MTSGETKERAAFGSVLRELRESAGLTQEELAERAGITVHGVSALERGVRTRPYPHTVRSLAAALELDDSVRRRLMAAVPASPAAQPAQPQGPKGADATRVVVPRTRLHGREADVDAVTGLVRAGRRLVTLTGPGGVGKTRLALALADRMSPDFVDGAVVVPAAHVTRTADLVEAVATAVDLPEGDPGSALDRLAGHIGARQLLLVLDNLEQVVEAGVPLAELVARCSALSVLVTSRTPLRVRDEATYAVEPLPAPPGAVASLADALEYPAAALFVERAQSVASGLAYGDRDAAVVAELCRQLAGIPLALELVAAQAGTLAPQELLDRLAQVLAQEGIADLPPRQRTLRATLEWSWALLSPGQRSLMERLCVFRAPFTLEAAEAVAGDHAADSQAAWVTLGRLVDHSLVQTVPQPEGRRYRILAPVAQDVLARLGGEQLADARRAHAAWVLQLTESAAPQYTREHQISWLQRLDAEEPDLDAALRWALEHDPEAAARMGWALWLFWWLRGHLRLGRDAMAQVLGTELPPAVRARALLTHAAMTFALGDLEVSGPGWRAAADLARTHGDVPAEACGRAGFGLVALAGGDLDTAQQGFQEALELAAQPGSGWVGEYLTGLAQVWLGTVALARGDVERAQGHLGRGLADARGRGDRLTAYVALFNVAQASLATGDHAGARAALVEAAELSTETHDPANLAFVLDGVAVLESAQERFTRVPVLVGAADALRELGEGRVYGYYLQDVDQLRTAVDSARAALGEDEYDDLLDRGRAMTFEDAVAAVVDAGDA